MPRTYSHDLSGPSGDYRAALQAVVFRASRSVPVRAPDRTRCEHLPPESSFTSAPHLHATHLIDVQAVRRVQVEEGRESYEI